MSIKENITNFFATPATFPAWIEAAICVESAEDYMGICDQGEADDAGLGINGVGAWDKPIKGIPKYQFWRSI